MAGAMLNTISFFSPNSTVSDLHQDEDGSFELPLAEDVRWTKQFQKNVVMADVAFVLHPGFFGILEILPKWKSLLSASVQKISSQNNMDPIFLIVKSKSVERITIKKGEPIIRIQFMRRICPRAVMVGRSEDEANDTWADWV